MKNSQVAGFNSWLKTNKLNERDHRDDHRSNSRSSSTISIEIFGDTLSQIAAWCDQAERVSGEDLEVTSVENGGQGKVITLSGSANAIDTLSNAVENDEDGTYGEIMPASGLDSEYLMRNRG